MKRETQFHLNDISPFSIRPTKIILNRGGVIPIIILIFMATLTGEAYGQSGSSCGSYSTMPPSGVNPDSLVSDRFGNTYDFSSLQVPTNSNTNVPTNCTNSGYFQPCFEGDPPTSITNVICEVLGDLAVKVPQRTTGNNCGSFTPPVVNLQIVWIDFANPDPGLLSQLTIKAASINPSDKLIPTSFYYSADDPACDEVALSRIFVKINGAGTPGTSALYDGRLLLNAGINWNLNTAAASGSFPGQTDLYTVVQHGMVHLLGYETRIGTGAFFTLWDQSLTISGGTPILSNASDCVQNCWTAAPEAGELAAAGSCELTIANIASVGGATSGGLSNLLSHLNPVCHEDDLLMQSEIPENVSRRVTNRELQVLCALGYAVPEIGCDGCFNIGQFDFERSENAACCFQTLYGCAGQPIVISAADLLCNDVTNGTHTISRIWSTNPNITVQDNLNQTWTITVSQSAVNSFLNRYFLSYTVKSCDCRLDNARFALQVDYECPDCNFSPDPCANMVCNGNFENFTNTSRREHLFGWPIIFQGAGYVGTPDIGVTNSAGHYLRMLNAIAGGNSDNKEAVLLPLKDCVQPGCNLTLNMDLSNAGTGQASLEIWGSKTRPCTATDPVVVPISNNCNETTQCAPGNIFAPICIADIPATSTSTDLVNPVFGNSGDIVWTNTATDEVCYLILTPAGASTLQDGLGLLVDNLMITRQCAPAISVDTRIIGTPCPGQTFSLEIEVCADATPGLNATDVDLQLDLPAGLSLVGGSGTFNFTLSAPQCTTLVASVAADPGITIGSTLEIGIGGQASGLCSNTDLAHKQPLTVVACPVFACPCSAGNTLNIDAGETNPLYNPALGGTLFSVLEASFNYDQDDNGVLSLNEHNGCIAINGRLIIDQGLTITGCQNIKMQPCAEIVVQGAGAANAGRQFYVRASRMYGCVGMWKGITVEAGASLLLRSNSLIADAEYAAQITPSSAFSLNATKVTIQNNNFKRNHIGVYIPGSGGVFFGGNVAQTPFIGNTFEAKDLLPACTQGLANYQSGTGYAGVAVYGAAFTVGNPGTSGIDNYFDRLRFGVIGSNVYLTVHRAKFTNISSVFNGAIPAEGVGIFGSGGFQNIYNCLFEDCGHAVFSGNGFLSMSDNQTNRVDVGLYTTAPVSFDVKDNDDILFREHGIYGVDLLNIPEVSAYRIDDNTFLTQGVHSGFTPRSAISLENAGGGSDMPPTAWISRNITTLNDNISGFIVNNQNRWKFTDNLTNFFMPSGSASIEYPGIVLSNAHRNYLYHNMIYDISDAPHASIGFSTNLSQQNKFCCNTTEGGFLGHYFSGSCASTEMLHNTMKQHYAPVYLNDGSIISPQGELNDPLTPQNEARTNGNVFEPGCGIATHLGGAFQAQSSQFRVTDMNQPNWPDGIDPSNLFVPNGAPASGCAADSAACPVEPYPDGDPQARGSDPMVAQYLFSGDPVGDGLQWESERDLYARLKQNPALREGDPSLEAFFETKDAGSALKAFYEADEIVAEIGIVPAAWTAALNNTRSALAQAEVSAEALQPALAAATNEADSTAIYWQVAAARAQKNVYTAAIGTILAQADSLRRVKAAAALPAILALPEAHLLQSNRKTAQRIFLEATAAGTHRLSTTQLTDITAVAFQCPRSGGTAVYLARALYRRNIPAAFDDTGLCTNTERLAAARPVSIPQPRLWPNPGTGRLNLDLPGAVRGQAIHLRILDFSGKTQKEVEVLHTGGTITLDASQLPSGIYWCRIQTADSVFAPVKVIITH